MSFFRKKHWPPLFPRIVCNFFLDLLLIQTFINDDPTTWSTQINHLHRKETVCALNVVNNAAERAVKLMEDFHGRLTKDDESESHKTIPRL